MMIASILSLLMAAAAPMAAADGAQTASFSGLYDGGQTEMAVQLELGADGRFRYGMIYGALDEMAEGTWIVDGGRILLTSDPVTPPRFLFLGQEAMDDGRLHVSLDVPAGLTRQLFDVSIDFSQGGMVSQQMAEEGLSMPFQAVNPPVALALFLPLFDVRSEPVAIDPAKGYALAFRFEPNDLGKVNFQRAGLKVDKGDLLLERHDRLIRFRRLGPP